MSLIHRAQQRRTARRRTSTRNSGRRASACSADRAGLDSHPHPRPTGEVQHPTHPTQLPLGDHHDPVGGLRHLPELMTHSNTPRPSSANRRIS